MRFGLFYQQQMPRPWTEGLEVRVFGENIEQAVLAERLGFDSLWVTEHHFLEEYSHSSAPEVFLGAVAARTQRIRLGHGIRHTPPPINPPARIAEAIGTLDVISNGRVEFGIGEGATRLELGAHYVPAKHKRAMSLEAAEQIANMMAMTPYPGWQGEYFQMECRNVVPKPVQKPHPPMWMACTNRETIKIAAQHGLGALAFTFLHPQEAQQWAQVYYDIIKSEQCVPLSHSVNARIAMVSGLSVHDSRAEAVRQGYHCNQFFKFALQATILKDSTPGHTDLWGDYVAQENGDAGMKRAVEEAIAAGDDYVGDCGTPDDIRRRMRIFQDAGIDDLLFTIQGGNRSHAEVTSTLERFARDVMPEFTAEDQRRRDTRQAELKPFIEAAMRRKKPMLELRPENIPVVLGATANISPSVQKIVA